MVDVYTGDVKDGGTDAEVFLTMYGEKAETSEIHLNKSKSHMNKFETDHVNLKIPIFALFSFNHN